MLKLVPKTEVSGGNADCAEPDWTTIMGNRDKALFDYLARLQSEQRNPDTNEIDLASAEDIVHLMNREDAKVAEVVAGASKEISKVIDQVAESFQNNGRLFYIGAGTSGRLGVLDASECPPTFGANPEMVQGHIAGGPQAMFVAQEGAEDSSEKGTELIQSLEITQDDFVCGLAASGRTPFVHGSLAEASKRGAGTAFIFCVPKVQVQMQIEPDYLISLPVGPEAIMGSTRLKSGTAQKMVCNMITTGAFIRGGKVYENVMVDLQITNQKLAERARRIVMMFTELSYDSASELLEKANNNVKKAIFMHFSGSDAETAEMTLVKHKGFLRAALESIGHHPKS